MQGLHRIILLVQNHIAVGQLMQGDASCQRQLLIPAAFAASAWQLDGRLASADEAKTAAGVTSRSSNTR